jgi:hypothetical protein
MGNGDDTDVVFLTEALRGTGHFTGTLAARSNPKRAPLDQEPRATARDSPPEVLA